MRLIDIIGADGVIARLKSRDRDEAIMEIVDRLIEVGRVTSEIREDVLMALLKREALGTTNIGNAVAIPHIKTPLVNEFVGAMARSRHGIDFGGEDGEVNVIILFLSPRRAVSGHLRLLAHIGGILKHDGYVRLLRDAEGKQELVELVRDAERMIFGEDTTQPPDEGGTPVLA